MDPQAQSDASSSPDPNSQDQGGGKEAQMAEMVLNAIEGLIPLVAQAMGKQAASVLQQAGQIVEQFAKGGAQGPQGVQPSPGSSEMGGGNPNAQAMG